MSGTGDNYQLQFVWHCSPLRSTPPTNTYRSGSPLWRARSSIRRAIIPSLAAQRHPPSPVLPSVAGRQDRRIVFYASRVIPGSPHLRRELVRETRVRSEPLCSRQDARWLTRARYTGTGGYTHARTHTHTNKQGNAHLLAYAYTRRNGGVCNTGIEYIIHSRISFCPVATLPRPCRLSSRLLSSFLGSPALPAPRANAAASEHPARPSRPLVSARHRVLLVPPFCSACTT